MARSSSLVERDEQLDQPNSQACINGKWPGMSLGFVINTTAYHVCLPIQPSSPSTKELHYVKN